MSYTATIVVTDSDGGPAAVVEFNTNEEDPLVQLKTAIQRLMAQNPDLANADWFELARRLVEEIPGFCYDFEPHTIDGGQFLAACKEQP